MGKDIFQPLNDSWCGAAAYSPSCGEDIFYTYVTIWFCITFLLVVYNVFIILKKLWGNWKSYNHNLMIMSYFFLSYSVFQFVLMAMALSRVLIPLPYYIISGFYILFYNWLSFVIAMKYISTTVKTLRRVKILIIFLLIFIMAALVLTTTLSAVEEDWRWIVDLTYSVFLLIFIVGLICGCTIVFSLVMEQYKRKMILLEEKKNNKRRKFLMLVVPFAAGVLVGVGYLTLTLIRSFYQYTFFTNYLARIFELLFNLIVMTFFVLVRRIGGKKKKIKSKERMSGNGVSTVDIENTLDLSGSGKKTKNGNSSSDDLALSDRESQL